MEGPVAYVNGEIVPESEARVSPLDRGFFCADAVFDTLRTVQHKPYLLAEHLARLAQSMNYADLTIGDRMAELEEATREVAARNCRMLPPNGDLLVRIFVTRGMIDRKVVLTLLSPNIFIVTEPISFSSFARRYETGHDVVTPPFREIPSQCFDPRIKTTSRMHYNLADLYVARTQPGAIPILMDIDGNLAQGITCNFFIVQNGTLVTSPTKSALSGISRKMALEIAAELEIPTELRHINLHDVSNAEEAFVTATSYCLLPVTSVNAVQVGTGNAGSVTRRILEAWSTQIGVDIVGQALSHLPA